MRSPRQDPATVHWRPPVCRPRPLATLPAESDSDQGTRVLRPLSDRLMTGAHGALDTGSAPGRRQRPATPPTWRSCTRSALSCSTGSGSDSCLEVDAKSVLFGSQVEGRRQHGVCHRDPRRAARRLVGPAAERHRRPVGCPLPVSTAAGRQALFAHCLGGSPCLVTRQPYDGRPKAMAHLDRVAEAVVLDMAEAGWGNRRPLISAASPRPGSSKPYARRRASRRQKGSRTSRRPI